MIAHLRDVLDGRDLDRVQVSERLIEFLNLLLHTPRLAVL
jgi:hypothetical protein